VSQALLTLFHNYPKKILSSKKDSFSTKVSFSFFELPPSLYLSANRVVMVLKSPQKNAPVNKRLSLPNITVVCKQPIPTPARKSQLVDSKLPAVCPTKRQRKKPLLDEDMSIREFLKLCRIPCHDYHTQHLFKTHHIHHWTALRNVTAKKLSKLRFCYGPAQLILQGIEKIAQKNGQFQSL
jgi:hypothetical protein